MTKNEDPFYNAVLENDPDALDPFDSTANALGLDSSLGTYDLAQNRKIMSNQLDAKLDYYYLIGSKSNINFTLGTLLSQQQFNSSIFQFLENRSEFVPLPTFNEGLVKIGRASCRERV